MHISSLLRTVPAFTKNLHGDLIASATIPQLKLTGRAVLKLVSGK